MGLLLELNCKTTIFFNLFCFYAKFLNMRLSFLLFIAVLAACQSEPTTTPITDLPIIDLQVTDIGSQLDDIETKDDLLGIMTSHPALAEILFTSALPIKTKDGTMDFDMFQKYQQDSSILELNALIEKEVASDQIKARLLSPMQHLKYYIPSFEVPNIYTWNSGLQYQLFLFQDGDRDGVCIGTDFFLGNAFPYETLSIQNPNFSKYNSRTFNTDHLAKKVMDGVLSDLIPYPKTERLLDLMIYNGKKMYILDQIMPNTPDTVIFEYTPQQLEWCQNNEKEMWAFFLDKDLFYETEPRKINKLVNPSPTSTGMPQEAPGRTANYVGYKIVQQYMLRNPNLSIKDLMLRGDAQQILDRSKYKPRS